MALLGLVRLSLAWPYNQKLSSLLQITGLRNSDSGPSDCWGIFLVSSTGTEHSNYKIKLKPCDGNVPNGLFEEHFLYGGGADGAECWEEQQQLPEAAGLSWVPETEKKILGLWKQHSMLVMNLKFTWSDKGRVENAGTLLAHLMLMKRRRAADSHTDSVATSYKYMGVPLTSWGYCRI
ncbi:hypothetical protein CCH79_00000414 [Gambusia affinis]|uniref:Uncharacterized protein n=1 Tax=Gambusia affinis TaxID=33528 RepID=A0A315VVQ4_GAMAF|nr:hypothetical protein CCH79_00000414 [Gambusia affinis]